MTTNWDRYLQDALRKDDARQRVDRAGLAWDIALQISALRDRRGLTHSQLAELMGTRQANASRLESGDYRGYTLQTLDRVARALGARLEITLAAAAKDSIGPSLPSARAGS